MSVAQLTPVSTYTGTTVKFSLSGVIPPVNSWTAMAWAYGTIDPSQAIPYQDLASVTDTGDVIGLGTKLNAGNTAYLLNLGDLNTDNVGATTIAVNTWHHYAITVQPTATGTACYGWLDGHLEVGPVALAAPVQANSLVQLWNSRASSTDPSSQWIGVATAFKLWDNVALNGDQIRREMWTYAPQRTQNLYAWTPVFDTGSKAVIFGGRAGSAWTFTGTVTESSLYPPGVTWDAPLARRRPSRYYRAIVPATAYPASLLMGI